MDDEFKERRLSIVVHGRPSVVKKQQSSMTVTGTFLLGFAQTLRACFENRWRGQPPTGTSASNDVKRPCNQLEQSLPYRPASRRVRVELSDQKGNRGSAFSPHHYPH